MPDRHVAAFFGLVLRPADGENAGRERVRQARLGRGNHGRRLHDIRRGDHLWAADGLQELSQQRLDLARVVHARKVGQDVRRVPAENAIGVVQQPDELLEIRVNQLRLLFR